MSRHTSGRGGAKPATSSTKKALDRSAGKKATMEAMKSRTRSHYRGTDKHNRWEKPDCGGPGDSVRGY